MPQVADWNAKKLLRALAYMVLADLIFHGMKMSSVSSVQILSSGARDGRLSAVRDVSPNTNLSALIQKLLR